MMHRQTQIFRIGVVVDGCVLLDLAVLMITAGYMGAVSVVTTVKWFWFLFGMAMFLPVIYSLARTFRETVITRKDPEMIELYGKIAWLTIIMWSFYPVVWLFSEGFASFSVSFEVCLHIFCVGRLLVKDLRVCQIKTIPYEPTVLANTSNMHIRPTNYRAPSL